MTGVELGDILQDIVNKICTEEETISNTIESFTLNPLKSDNWIIGDDCEISLDSCGEITQSTQIQALYSRMNSFCKILEEQQTKIEELESTISEQQLKLDNVQNCCE